MPNKLIGLFRIEGNVTDVKPYGEGHINTTYLVTTDTGDRYILQRINNKVFPNVSGLMRNIELVTAHLSAKDPDPRHTLHLIPTVDGKTWVETEDGFWRMYAFVEDSLCLQAANTEEDFRQSAVAFGAFQAKLADFPAAELVETIPHFHDTPDRYRQLHEAIREDRAHRLSKVQAEVDFALAREEDGAELMNLLTRGELPLRVTHNDTKLNNVLLDGATRMPLCVIDLDTVMPGLAAYDFGDSIRFGASTAAEDEKDLSKVSMSLRLFEVFANGYLESCGERLTAKEKETLPIGAKLMTLECGIRFLADYLNGDVYFRTHYAEQNLDRCRTQFKLVKDMEEKHEQMMEIIRALEK